MLLAIDIGNSNISLGVFDEKRLRTKAKASAQAERSADEYAIMLSGLLQAKGTPPELIDGCILSSVVPGLTALVSEAVHEVTGADPLRVGPGIRTGFRIRIDDPSQLGGDLAADTLAALIEYGAPVIIIDSGTVTTISAVDRERTFLGGCILPGLRSGAAMMEDSAALLPTISLNSPEGACLGRNSAEAMRCGLLLSTAMAVDGFIDRYRALPGMDGAAVVSTGGSAHLATAACQHAITYDPDLTLKGLMYLYANNRPKNV